MLSPRRLVFFCAVLFALSLSVAAFSEQRVSYAQYAQLGYVPGQVLVKFKGGTSETLKASIHKLNGAKAFKQARYGGYAVADFARNANVARVVAAYRRNRSVLWAEPNYLCRAQMVPNDPLYFRQWDLSNPVTGGIHMEGAWDYTLGDPSVKVAVLDTGVAYEDYDSDHDGLLEYMKAPDLGETRFAPGFDFVNGDSHANDDEGHGTHVTGTIAQSTNNNLGCAGVAPNVTIMPVKVLDEFGSGTYEAVANGIYFAANQGAKVINMSLGGYYDAQSLRDACWYAYTRGVTIVAATGNDGASSISYPAGFDESVIAVGATDFNNERTGYSNYGTSLDFSPLSYGLDLMAPGGDSAHDYNEDGFTDGILQQTLVFMVDPFTGEYTINPLVFDYEAWDGTSMGSPHVAGVAALLVSVGITSPSEVRRFLQNTATDLNTAGYDLQTGWGLVNAEEAVYQALLSLGPSGPDAYAGADQTTTDFDGDGMEPVILDGTASSSAPGFPIVAYEWWENGILLGAGPVLNPRFSVGSHGVALLVRDSLNRSDTDMVVVTVNPGPPIVRVLGIDVITQLRYGKKYIVAIVTVVDGPRRPVYRARVYGRFTGTSSKTMTPAYTNTLGQVTFTLGAYKVGAYTFTVTNVTKSGATYRPDLNVETSDSITFR